VFWEAFLTADPKTASTIPNFHEQGSELRSGAFSGHPNPSQQAGAISRTQVWLLRLRALLFVTVCATFGVLLVIVPWTSHWTDNPLLLAAPALRSFLANGFVRGLASGLGMLDLWLGFWEAIHYHENPS
jgi:hypothetical protein